MESEDEAVLMESRREIADEAFQLLDGLEAEVDRRSEELDAGSVQGIPWQTVRSSVRQKVLGHA